MYMMYCWSQKFTNTYTFFQPLHKFVSFCKSVRTSTSCMTQVIFQTIVYRQIISLIIHCITTPVGQKFTYTKLTVPLNSLEHSRKYVMALEASDRLIDIIWVNWRCTCGCISRPFFKLSTALLDIMGKSKEISQDLRKKIGDPPQVSFILGSNFQICTNNSTQV